MEKKICPVCGRIHTAEQKQSILKDFRNKFKNWV